MLDVIEVEASSQFEIRDNRGRRHAGPFETREAAAAAMKRIDGKPPRRKYDGTPSAARLAKQADAAPGWIRDASIAHFDPHADREYRESRLGTFGPASEVRKIDPATWLAEQEKEKNPQR
ncbi:hypothetical protein G8E10_17615 [Rhizobiaceae bacterium CRRU44]|uniref:Uncharacterized protein n=1 Tax=Ferranicluibacter rubi TaxID=2715133 RepID=A0AA43ZI90_9HYPH|nr:hypothetical protein [Ferranicluibacter rubi]NHT77535.1 hypothetical protein [Ferranicluibacter rubi]